MKYIGIDPGKYKLFISVLDEESNILFYHCIESQLKNDIDRQYDLYNKFNDFLCDKFIDGDCQVAIEGPVYSFNIKTTYELHRNIVVAELVCSSLSIPIIQVDNKVWKKNVLGNGKANKEDIRKFFNMRWEGFDFLEQDFVDSFCIALHLYFQIGRKK